MYSASTDPLNLNTVLFLKLRMLSNISQSDRTAWWMSLYNLQLSDIFFSSSFSF